MINLTGKCPSQLSSGFKLQVLGDGISKDGRKRCVINVAFATGYPVGQARLVESLREIGYSGALMTWTDVVPDGSPWENTVPRGFKVYAFEQAKRAGYDLVLWLDASLWAVRPLDRIFELAQERGCYVYAFRRLIDPGTEDLYRVKFGIPREKASSIALVLGGIWGIDFCNATGNELHRRMSSHVVTPGAFTADTNRDEGPLSVEVWRMGIKPETSPGSYCPFHLGAHIVVDQHYLDEHNRVILLHCGC